jgi:hypothetical protein
MLTLRAPLDGAGAATAALVSGCFEGAEVPRSSQPPINPAAPTASPANTTIERIVSVRRLSVQDSKA